MAAQLVQKEFNSAIDDAGFGLYDNTFDSKTTAYDSSCVLKLISMMKVRDIFEDNHVRFTSIAGDKDSLFYNESEMKLALVKRPDNELFMTKYVQFTICGDFGADHDDVEALIILCNLCNAYPHLFKITCVSCSNVVDCDNNPINNICIKIAQSICFMLLPNKMFKNIVFMVHNKDNKNRKKLLHPILYDLKHNVFSEFKFPKPLSKIVDMKRPKRMSCFPNKSKVYPRWRKCIVSISSASVPNELITADTFIAAMGLIDHLKLDSFNEEINLQNVPYYLETKALLTGDNFLFDREDSISLLQKISIDNIRCLFVQKGLTTNRLTFQPKFRFKKYFLLTYKIAVLNVVRQWIDEPNYGKFPRVKALCIPAFTNIMESLLEDIIIGQEKTVDEKVNSIIKRLNEL